MNHRRSAFAPYSSTPTSSLYSRNTLLYSIGFPASSRFVHHVSSCWSGDVRTLCSRLTIVVYKIRADFVSKERHMLCTFKASHDCNDTTETLSQFIFTFDCFHGIRTSFVVRYNPRCSATSRAPPGPNAKPCTPDPAGRCHPCSGSTIRIISVVTPNRYREPGLTAIPVASSERSQASLLSPQKRLE